MKRTEARERLLQMADPSFKDFNDKIVNCDTVPSIGVRAPQIRGLASQIAKQDFEQYLLEMEVLPADGQAEQSSVVLFQEEHMLQGIVLGSAKMSDEARVRHLDKWVPGIVSWADCDCSVSSFKFMKKNQDFWFRYNVKWLEGGREFETRYAIVALMQYFINDDYIDRVLEIFSGESTQASFPADSPYYVKMAQAWALSVCFVKYRNKTLELLSEKCMDPWVQNKAIQKCRESYRVSKEDKELLLTMKMSS